MSEHTRKRSKLKSSYSIYYIGKKLINFKPVNFKLATPSLAYLVNLFPGRCTLSDWENKLLQETALECYHDIITHLPYSALQKRNAKIKIDNQGINFKGETVLMEV